jgi:2-polyprenyl-3-methyl-5-hydroxy-6-metoxy-1,4-benzoquinol methylase
MWSEIADDPNSADARRYRQAQLDAAWRTERRGRTALLRELCLGRKVLDVGCVGHASRIGHDRWLHGQLAGVAGECLGIDVDEQGVQLVRAGGYDALVADITADPLPESLVSRSPFDVVVAGEVIEHLPCPQSLLAFAMRVLRPGGQLVVTTPNPYAPWRGRAGRGGAVLENVDHVVYAFPSGIAEMADRTGMHLALACSVDKPFTWGEWRSVKTPIFAALRRAGGNARPEPIGRLGSATGARYLRPLQAVTRYLRSLDRVGETSI